MLIRDLIQLKEVRSIIQLGRPEDQCEVLQCFIWTEDIRFFLEDFAARLVRKEGGGIFLKGHYGTGKSHLLAWLQEQAKLGWRELKTSLGSQHALEVLRPYHASAISLIHYSSERSLESIVEESLGWHKDGAQARPPFYKAVMSQWKSQGLDGGMILFDELSEFLKSKPTPSGLAEDLRYLQFLAEFGREEPLWVIGAIQEDIEGIGSADRETSLKLKDRFPLRWNLSTLHVEAILSARLIERKKGAEDFLSRFFLRCQEFWPRTFTNHQSFLAVYPLHPSTLDFLMGLGPLFSEHRGALRFTQDLLSGRWSPRNKPCIEREDHELLGPELLFDYFLNRFNENLELREYYSKAWVHLEHRCRELLEPRDHELGLRMIKILLIATVDPRREGLSIDELQGMLMLRVNTSAETGREFLQYLLSRLMGRVNYLVKKDDRLVIDLKHQSQELLQRLLDHRLAGLRIDQSATWGRLVELCDTRPLELRTLWSHPEHIGPVVWLNTNRKLTIGFGEDCPTADLRITLPGQIPLVYPEQQLTWVPRMPTKEEEQLLLEAAAILTFVELSPQTNTEQQAKAEAIKRKKSEVSLWRATLEGLFKEGKWFLGSHQIHPQLEWHSNHSFESFLESPVYELFSLRHPLFRNVAPKIPYYTDSSYLGLIENFVGPGEVAEAQMKTLHLEDSLRGLAIPLGVAQKVRQTYRFLWEPLQSPLIEAFCQAQQQFENYTQARLSLEQGPWGLPHSSVSFLAWAAIASGHFQAQRQGEVLAVGKISFHNIDTIDKLVPCECLPITVVNSLLEDRFFSQADQSYSGLSLQRQLWNYCRQQLQNAPRWLQEWDDTQLHGAWAFALPKMLEHRETIAHFNNIIQTHELNATAGLSCLYEQRQKLPALCEALIWAKEFHRSMQKHSEELQELWIQLFDEFLDELPKNESWLARREDRRALLAEYKQWQEQDSPFEALEAWIAQARHWLSEYREIYAEAHRQALGSVLSADEREWLSELQRQHLPCPAEQESACVRRPDLELINKPYCRCGFVPHLGQASSTKSLNYAVTLQALQQHFSHDANLDSLLGHIANAQWREALIGLKNLLAKKRVPPTKKLSLNHLKRECQNKTFTREQLLRHIDQWLAKEGDVVFVLED